ncbi:MAG: tetratricopeptide repeat protein [Bacteroidota bacterium]
MNSMTRFLIFLLPLCLIIGCSKPNAEEMYKKGENAQREENYDGALEAYHELIAAYPDSARTPEAYYALGVIYQNYKHDNRTAMKAYHDLVVKFPHHPVSPNAAFILGFMYENDFHQLDSAKAAFEFFLNNYPNDALSSSARLELSNLGKDPAQVLTERLQHPDVGKSGPENK